jgi:3-oxoacyl-[acyl-carrier-protein] synthase II
MVELIAGVLSLRHGRLYPVLNYATPDPACPVQVATDDRAEPGSSFVNLSVTPQGQASAAILRAF